jgi:hypothetical protein
MSEVNLLVYDDIICNLFSFIADGIDNQENLALA